MLTTIALGFMTYISLIATWFNSPLFFKKFTLKWRFLSDLMVLAFIGSALTWMSKTLGALVIALTATTMWSLTLQFGGPILAWCIPELEPHIKKR